MLKKHTNVSSLGCHSLGPWVRLLGETKKFRQSSKSKLVETFRKNSKNCETAKLCETAKVRKV